MQTKTRREIFLLFFLIFWILFVLGGYYYYHKPINLEMIAPPLSGLLDILFVVLFAGLAGGIGRRLMHAERLPRLERAAVQFALGAGVLSLVWFLLGIAGLYRYPLAAPLLVLGILAVQRDARAWYRDIAAIQEPWQRANALEKTLAGITAALVIYQMFVALAPPFKWDALAYHLQLPRQYLAAGGFVFVPENPYWGHPQLIEMLYTFAMSFHRTETAALLGWSAGVIFLLGLLSATNTQLARMQGGPVGSSAGWMAVAAVTAGYTFRFLLAWSYTDIFSALFGLAALIAFFEWLEQREERWFLWAGLFCGLAVGTKWTSGVLALAIFTGGLVFRKASRPGLDQKPLALKTWVLAGMLAFLAVVPWLAKNLLVTGSPLYPYFFGTPWYDAARLASANPTEKTIEWWLHIFLPFSSTWAGVDSAPGFGADLGPLLLLFALPGYILYRKNPQAKIMGILLGFTALGLGIASLRYGHLRQTRLYYVMLPALAIPCGWGWEWVQCQVLQGVRMRRIFSAVVLLVMGFAFWQDSYTLGSTQPQGVFLGSQTRQTYMENTLGYYIVAMQRLEALPADTRTLMLWEPRGFYAPINVTADPWIDRWRTDRREVNDAAGIVARWKKQGFTHLLVYEQGVELIAPQPEQPPSADWAMLQQTFALLPKPESIGGFYSLYQLP